MKRSYFLLLLIALTAPAAAGNNDGPFAPPCPNCPEYTRPPYPHTGMWHNPQRSGTGINIDVQNGIMAAVYYGYREDGSSVWYLFSGHLEKSEAEDAYWELEAELYEASNGEPVNGQHRKPDMEPVATIYLEVMQRHLLRFSIDGGPPQRMAPLTFGSHLFQPFQPESDVRVPDFKGTQVFETEAPNEAPWLIIQKNPDGGSRWGYGYVAYYPHWGSSSIGGNVPWIYSIPFYEHAGDFHIQGSAEIRCGFAEEMTSNMVPEIRDRFIGRNEPMCFVWVGAGGPPGEESLKRYYMPVGDLGDRRFTAVSDDGWVVEGFRLEYD